MSDQLQRRDFIKRMSFLGAGMLIDGRFLLSGHRDTEMRNDFFSVACDPGGGTYYFHRSDGAVLLTGGTSGINTTRGKRLLSAQSYERDVSAAPFHDALGSGSRLTILARDEGRQLDAEVRISAYDRLEVITLEILCTNVSANDIHMQSLEPLRAVASEGGALSIPGVSKCITNGEMFPDPGVIHEFGRMTDWPANGEIGRMHLANSGLSPSGGTVHSWWNVGLYSGYDREGIVVGYLDNEATLGHVLLSRTELNSVSCITESVYAPEVTLRPGRTLSSNRVILIVAKDVYKALEQYADAVGRVHNARCRSVVNGWCSWFYTLANVSEEEVLRNTEYAARHLKQFGLEYIQIDEGYQRWHGDWEGNERFPHGMKWLATKIREFGFKPGLWISPYVIAEPCSLFHQHPEWLVHHKDGTLQRVGNWDDENSEAALRENPKRYCLDITHPGAASWMHGLFDTIVNSWGYEMIKVDFVAWSILAASQYHDSSIGAAQVYRRGMEIMRNAAGTKCHILECGPGAVTVGLIDSMRIEADVNYGFSHAAWETYFLHPACSASAAAKRYYFHKRTWINDADHVCLDLLTSEQSQAVATLIALSGGNIISGDRLTDLDPVKLEILKKIIPSYGEAAIPVDLFDGEMQSVFALNIDKPFGRWSVIAFFNASLTDPVEQELPLQRFALNPERTYLAFDFWRQQFIGEVKGMLKVRVQPGSVRLLCLHEKKGRPQVLSTDRHVLQGAVELDNVDWDDHSNTLSGVSNGPVNSSHTLSVYLPENHPWTWGGYVLFRDYDSYSLRLVDPNIIRVHVRFEKGNSVQWKINIEEYDK